MSRWIAAVGAAAAIVATLLVVGLRSTGNDPTGTAAPDTEETSTSLTPQDITTTTATISEDPGSGSSSRVQENTVESGTATQSSSGGSQSTIVTDAATISEDPGSGSSSRVQENTVESGTATQSSSGGSQSTIVTDAATIEVRTDPTGALEIIRFDTKPGWQATVEHDPDGRELTAVFTQIGHHVEVTISATNEGIHAATNTTATS